MLTYLCITFSFYFSYIWLGPELIVRVRSNFWSWYEIFTFFKKCGIISLGEATTVIRNEDQIWPLLPCNMVCHNSLAHSNKCVINWQWNFKEAWHCPCLELHHSSFLYMPRDMKKTLTVIYTVIFCYCSWAEEWTGWSRIIVNNFIISHFTVRCAEINKMDRFVFTSMNF